ncbi:MAG: twin-arginine translocation signal domain-containing protein, partial [Proteobacteria bacterium]|nr:twin-arginine translocation signal domain-containing protein [Pseudomonadota bacterium]
MNSLPSTGLSGLNRRRFLKRSAAATAAAFA